MVIFTPVTHPCEIIYNCTSKPVFGTTEGMCRIIRKVTIGLPFKDWVKPTFTDFSSLYSGDIISNAALFCFQELSSELQQITGKEKPQNFRTYSHFVIGGKWHMKHKGEKADMLQLMLSDPEVCVISESGQKHLAFKHKPGTWQLEEEIIIPDKTKFKFIHSHIRKLAEEFSNDEIKSGNYQQHRIMKLGIDNWRIIESEIKHFRGSAMFDLALFFSKIDINDSRD